MPFFSNFSILFNKTDKRILKSVIWHFNSFPGYGPHQHGHECFQGLLELIKKYATRHILLSLRKNQWHEALLIKTHRELYLLVCGHLFLNLLVGTSWIIMVMTELLYEDSIVTD